MENDNPQSLAAPFLLAVLVTIIINVFVFLAGKLHLERLDLLLGLPSFALGFCGVVLVVLWFPIFLESAYLLGLRGGLGQTEKFLAAGIYQHLIHPLYSGLGFSILGSGLMANRTGIFLSGVAVMALLYWWSGREDERLEKKYGQEYLDYRSMTPRFIPRFRLLFKDFFSRNGR